MTQDEFSKFAFRHSEVIIFHQQHPEVDVECMLLAVDFDCGTFKLCPIDTGYYEDESFYTSYEYCDKPRKAKIIIGDNSRLLSMSLHSRTHPPKKNT